MTSWLEPQAAGRRRSRQTSSSRENAGCTPQVADGTQPDETGTSSEAPADVGARNLAPVEAVEVIED